MAGRAPPGRINGKVFARRHGAEVHGRLMERWKAEGTYFASRGKIPLSAFAGGCPRARSAGGSGVGRPLERKRELDPRAHAQLAVRVREVTLDGADGQEQALGDLAVRASGCSQASDT